MEKVLVVWIEYQTSYNIPWNPSLIKSKSVKAKSDEDASEEKFEANKGGWWGLKKNIIS